LYSDIKEKTIMGQNGIPISFAIIISAAILGATFLAAMVILAVFLA